MQLLVMLKWKNHQKGCLNILIKNYFFSNPLQTSKLLFVLIISYNLIKDFLIILIHSIYHIGNFQ